MYSIDEKTKNNLRVIGQSSSDKNYIGYHGYKPLETRYFNQWYKLNAPKPTHYEEIFNSLI